MASYGPGGDPPLVTPSSQSIVGQYPPPSVPGAIVLAPPGKVPTTLLPLANTGGQLAGPSYVQPPVLMPTTTQTGFGTQT